MYNELTAGIVNPHCIWSPRYDPWRYRQTCWWLVCHWTRIIKRWVLFVILLLTSGNNTRGTKWCIWPSLIKGGYCQKCFSVNNWPQLLQVKMAEVILRRMEEKTAKGPTRWKTGEMGRNCKGSPKEVSRVCIYLSVKEKLFRYNSAKENRWRITK